MVCFELEVIIPGQPTLGLVPELSGMSQECGEVMEGIDLIGPTGFDETHEQIADQSPIFSPEEIGIFPVKDCFFQGPFDHI